MGTSTLNGLNFELGAKGTNITIFGQRGTIIGDTWYFNGILGDVLVPSATKDSMLPAIQDCIQQDIEAGNEAKIAALQLAPLSAVVLFLEGVLTRDHFKSATETPETPETIEIDNVDIDGRRLKLRILKGSHYNVATVDAEGNIL
jgi:hypothetical protein